jgi:hypothetical protein
LKPVASPNAETDFYYTISDMSFRSTAYRPVANRGDALQTGQVVLGHTTENL